MIAPLALLLVRAQPEQLSLTVNGVARTALVYPSRSTTSIHPCVLVFHGHFGTAAGAARNYRVQDSWSEAVVVYPQGLPNDSPFFSRPGNGWQRDLGGDGDRDLSFMDALLPVLRSRFGADPRHSYACGMSNGAVFSLLLYEQRSPAFAAFASVAGAKVRFETPHQPRPVLLINGRKDPLARPAAAQATLASLLRKNQCGQTASRWDGYDLYKGNVPVVMHWHEGAHTWPSDATEHIVSFFKTFGS
jgi:poly(3-hydroxybutyrate) depolymerase